MNAKTASDFVFYASVSTLILSLFMTLAANGVSAPNAIGQGLSECLEQMAKAPTAGRLEEANQGE
jgi:hypothetical protein